jgi:hypothetical protein
MQGRIRDQALFDFAMQWAEMECHTIARLIGTRAARLAA